ncbi:glycoside hydrolase family 65 protein [Microbacterium amylolyticum]|uniref:Alpha,alpha-trehalose phosphorylase n=1 Tax=Microbacterium amylolyticum TaxID=936337 RepID=A0ABS4ZJI9_9MICO|nr:glycoside hydrolase family 65 protein [Microbacterium amylolyticum]MBP2437458.1 alpha,alpha-trehalose phosphorylase [Microbacterium amylolyticum]
MIDRERFPIDPWRLVETRYSDEDLGVTETIFATGNGYLGLRGNQPEGRHAQEHGTFINGFHETWPIRHAEDAYGFAEVGQTIVNVPDTKVMRVYVDDEPMSIDLAELVSYERSLDFRDASHNRSVRWITPSGKEVLLESRSLVSFTDRHLVVLQMTVTVVNADAPVVINCQMINRQDGEDVYGGRPVYAKKNGEEAEFDPRKSQRLSDRVLEPQEYWQTERRSVLSYETSSSGMRLAVVADHEITTDNTYTSRALVEPDIAKNVFRVDAKAGIPTTVTKFVAYHTSRGAPVSELIDRGRRTLDRATAEGAEAHFTRQRAWLDDFWDRSDVKIAGQDSMQQATRWCLLQVAMASARADGWGVPAKGMTGSGYSGHYFWDTDIYVLPFLDYTSPWWARNALRMRSAMLPAARRRARQMSEEGALIPWRTINGEEASAYYAAGTAQYHINADVAYAVVKYVRATGDEEFMAREGVDLLVETARLWATLGFWRTTPEGDSFHIHGVTGPDEYTTVVNDNLFTNVMARFNLRAAAVVVREMAERSPADYRAMVSRLNLSADEPERWERVGNHMHIPYSEAAGIHPQDAQFLEREVWDLENTPDSQRPLLLHYHPLVIYRFQVLKQADVVLAQYLHGRQFTDEEKLADFDYYDPLTTGDSTLSAVVQAVMAAEVGYRDLALEYFEHALFVDLADLHGNTSDGVHIASAGGSWTALVSGFGGMRDDDGRLTFDPRLPVTWPQLSFPLQWQGARLDVTVRQREIAVAMRDIEGTPAKTTFSVRGEDFTVAAGESVAVPLTHHGPVIAGKPCLKKRFREDGSPLEAAVPPESPTSPIPIHELTLDEDVMRVPTNS